MKRLDRESRLELLIQSVRDYAIFMLDPQGRVETWNRGAEAIKGYTADEIIGKPLETFYTPEDRAAQRPRKLLEIAARDGRVEDEGMRVRKDGTQFFADAVITALRDNEGTLVGFAKVTRDLTEKRKLDMRLAQAQEAVRMRDEFLSIASHELRTPLMSLQLQIESLRRQISTDDKLKNKLDRADRSVRRLTDLVDTLLDVTRIASGRLTLNPARVDLGEVIRDSVDRMREAAEHARSKVTENVERGLVGGWDPLRMGQVITNLMANAFKYAAGSDVGVTARADGDRARITVSDRGPGIPSEHLERVFGRFERAADSRHHGGLGLGLYVTREIVLAHNGTIRAYNRDTGGAMFEIELPRHGLEL